jgi:YVTN family beta-propeller protein
LAVDPDQRHLYVVNPNFDLLHDGGSVVTIDLAKNTFVPEASIQVPNFGGVLLLRENDAGRLVGYLPDRSTSGLTWFFIDKAADGTPVFRCSEVAAPEGQPADCDRNHRVTRARVNDRTLTLGGDPYGAGTRELPSGEGILFTGSLSDGVLAVMELDDEGAPTLVDSRTLADAGLYGIATSPASNVTYVATQFAQRLYTVTTEPATVQTLPAPAPDVPPTEPGEEVAELGPISAISAIDLANAASGSTFAQSIVFHPDGSRAYATFRAPPAVAVLDTSVDGSGKPRNTLLGWIPVGSRPAEMALVPRQSGPGWLLYVVCFTSNELWVIDTEQLAVVDVIRTGIGPYDAVFVSNPELQLRRLYVTLFEEDSVAAIELDERSPFYHQVVSAIR